MPKRNGLRGSTFWRGKSVIVSYPLPAHLDRRDDAGKRRYDKIVETYPDEATAFDRLLELNHAHRTGTLATPDRQLLGDYLDEWLATKAHLAFTSRRNYGYDCDRIRQYIGHLELRHVDTLVIERWHADMRAAKDVSTRAAKHAHTRLSQALRAAVNAGRIPTNHATRVPAPRHTYQRGSAWEPDDAVAFAAHVTTPGNLETNRYLGASFWITMLYTGLRISETLALRWSDSDLQNSRITVSRTAALIDAHTYAPTERAKSEAGYRTVPIPARLVTMLRAHRATQNEQRLKMGRHWQDHDLIWTRWDGSIVGYHTTRQQFQRIVEQAGLPRITPHGLRHTAASLMLERGVPVTTVQEILGHADVRLTLNLYSHSSQQAKRDAVQGLDDLLGGTGT